MKRDERKIILRCAVYTRVSTDSGLEQDFNSLDNQREASEAYVKSQAQEGWKLVRERYDDGDNEHRAADPQHALVLRPVRARDHGRANPSQGRRLEAEGHLDGRSSAGAERGRTVGFRFADRHTP